MPLNHKRSLCPSSSRTSTSTSKRLRTSSSSQPVRTQPLTLNASSLSDELFLSILIYLSPFDLSSVERVDRHFLRLANDPHLWRRLFLDSHPGEAQGLGKRVSWRLPSTGSAEGGRHIAPLPSRARQHGSPMGEQPGVDWKYLFRVSTNWASGRSSLFPLLSSSVKPQSPTLASPIPSPPPSSFALDLRPPPRPQTLLALSNPFVVSASRCPTSTIPDIQLFLAKTHHSFEGRKVGSEVLVFQSEGLAKERSTGWLRGRVAVQDLAVDGAGWLLSFSVPSSDEEEPTRSSSLRLYVSYNSGAFSIFLLTLALDASTSSCSPLTILETNFQPSPTAPPLHPPLISSLHSSLLVTCTETFLLSFYNLPPPSDATSLSPALQPFRTLKSHTSWFPASLLLCPKLDTFSSAGIKLKATLAYSIPVYPSSWSVALQEIVLVEDNTTRGGGGWSMESTRTLSALSPFTSQEEDSAAGEAILGGRVTGLGLSQKFVCVGGADNSVLCFEIPEEREEGEKRLRGVRDGGDGKLRLGQTMGAHWAEVRGVSVFGDRCITGDSLGRILVWNLPSLFPPPPSLPSTTIRSSSPLNSRSLSPAVCNAPFDPPTPLDSSLPSPPPTPHPSSSTRAALERRYVEVLPPPKPNGDARGEEKILWVGQDSERILSLSVAREDWEEGEGEGDGGGEEKAKIWGFDC